MEKFLIQNCSILPLANICVERVTVPLSRKKVADDGALVVTIQTADQIEEKVYEDSLVLTDYHFPTD